MPSNRVNLQQLGQRCLWGAVVVMAVLGLLDIVAAAVIGLWRVLA